RPRPPRLPRRRLGFVGSAAAPAAARVSEGGSGCGGRAAASDGACSSPVFCFRRNRENGNEGLLVGCARRRRLLCGGARRAAVAENVWHEPRVKGSNGACRRRDSVRSGSYHRRHSSDREVAAMAKNRHAHELLLIEEADAWFEYLEATRGQSATRYSEVEPWAWARLRQRLRAIRT